MNPLDHGLIILFPTATEATPFIAKYSRVPISLYEAGVPVALCEGISVALCGVGLAECAASTARIISENRPHFLILAGIAGAYPAALSVPDTATNSEENLPRHHATSSEYNSPNGPDTLRKGSTVLVSRENSADLGTATGGTFEPLSKNPALRQNSPAGSAYNYYDCPTPLPDIFPNVVSNSVNTASTGYLNPLLPRAAIENMEGAAFFAVCSAMRMPCAEIRVISNFVGEPREEWITGPATKTLSESLSALLEIL